MKKLLVSLLVIPFLMFGQTEKKSPNLKEQNLSNLTNLTEQNYPILTNRIS